MTEADARLIGSLLGHSGWVAMEKWIESEKDECLKTLTDLNMVDPPKLYQLQGELATYKHVLNHVQTAAKIIHRIAAEKKAKLDKA